MSTIIKRSPRIYALPGGGAGSDIREWDSVGSTFYLGYAPTGSATSAPVWVITKLVVGANGTTLTTTVATNVKWDDRLTATYS